MTGPGEEPPPQPTLGDYELLQLLSEGTRTRTYQARQISVSRDVVLERLKPEALSDPQLVEAFLADVRAKAAVDHTNVGSVYEAVQTPEAVYYTREWLPGQSLEELHNAGESMPPPQVVPILRQIGEAMEYLQKRRIGTLPIEPRHLVLGPHGVLRMVNLAVADEPDSTVERHDKAMVAELLLDFLQRGVPGATRSTTLLKMMMNTSQGGLTWT